jgi:hypothetical protein
MIERQKGGDTGYDKGSPGGFDYVPRRNFRHKWAVYLKYGGYSGISF